MQLLLLRLVRTIDVNSWLKIFTAYSFHHFSSFLFLVQHFITAMDAVKLDQRAVDELQPLLSDLMNALIQLPDTPNDFGPNYKVQNWLEKLNAMRAVDMIDEDDGRQLYHDLDTAYSEFSRYLKSK